MDASVSPIALTNHVSSGGEDPNNGGGGNSNPGTPSATPTSGSEDAPMRESLKRPLQY